MSCAQKTLRLKSNHASTGCNNAPAHSRTNTILASGCSDAFDSHVLMSVWETDNAFVLSGMMLPCRGACWREPHSFRKKLCRHFKSSSARRTGKSSGPAVRQVSNICVATARAMVRYTMRACKKLKRARALLDRGRLRLRSGSNVSRACSA